MIFQWNILCFHKVVLHECETLLCPPINMHHFDWSFYHLHTKIQYIFHFCQEQESVSMLLHKVGWGYSFDAQACFHGLFLCTSCITQSTSLGDPDLMTSIWRLENQSEKNWFFSQNIHSIFWRTKWVLLLIWIIIATNWFYDNIVSQFGPCIGIIYLKLMFFWIFVWCNKNSLRKFLILVWICLFMTNTCPSPLQSHFIRTCHLEDEFWKFLIHLKNHLSSRRQVFNRNV